MFVSPQPVHGYVPFDLLLLLLLCCPQPRKNGNEIKERPTLARARARGPDFELRSVLRKQLEQLFGGDGGGGGFP